ncbi:MAG: YhcH/YjgK/YiaL family protein [Phycisphaerae bacterium]|nr:YhcH/YjgK/YiaL family protein [Phycisphaerae bacterium]
MIVDKLENAHLYARLSDKINIAFGILKDKKLSLKKEGRYEIDGKNLYYTVQHYTTKPVSEGKLEAHEKYIDIQLVTSGEEFIGYTLLDQVEIEKPYDELNDILFYKVPDEVNTVKLCKGMFCILFPQDKHMPGCYVKEPTEVCKIVVKVRMRDLHGIRARLQDAEILYRNGRKEGALLSVLVAVAATSKKRYPKVKSDKEAFIKFAGEEMFKITGGIRKYRLKFRNEIITLEDLLYKFVRCELAHEGNIPEDIVFEENYDQRYVVTDRQIILPYRLLKGLALAVIEAPENKDLFEDK